MKKRNRASFILIALAITSYSYAEDGAKTLFFDESTVISDHSASSDNSSSAVKKTASSHSAHSIAKPEKQYMGVSYWVDLERNGQYKRVASSYPFISGDKIQLRLKTNKDGYLYVSTQGTTGKIQKLFPRNNQDSFVRTDTLVSIPNNQMMRFDNNVGKENLWITLSAVPLMNEQTSVPPQNNPRNSVYQQVTQVTEDTVVYKGYNGCGSKDLLLEGGEGDLNKVQQSCGSKDLVVEDDANSIQPANYIVAPVNSLLSNAPIMFPIILTHN